MIHVNALLQMLPEPNRKRCEDIWYGNRELFQAAWGSSHNHQARPGGYCDHITDVMNLALTLHHAMTQLRPLPFLATDAMLVLFLHDLEKPWRFSSLGSEKPILSSKADKAAFRLAKISEYGIVLSPQQENALKYVEGEKDDYSSKERVMNELAAFCHMCDVASARIWHE